VGASKVKVTKGTNNWTIYWRAAAAYYPSGSYTGTGGTSSNSLQVKILVERGAADSLEAVTKVTVWADIQNLVTCKAVYDYQTKDYNFWSRNGAVVTAGPITGGNSYLGIGNGAVFAAFGNGTKMITFMTYNNPQTSYIVADADVTSTISGTDKSFLDSKLPSTTGTWASVTGSGTVYDGLYGTSGTFSSEMDVATVLP